MCWMKGFLLKSRDDKLREDQLRNHLSKSKIGTINLIMEKILLLQLFRATDIPN